jgi:hypothetical protein
LAEEGVYDGAVSILPLTHEAKRQLYLVFPTAQKEYVLAAIGNEQRQELLRRAQRLFSKLSRIRDALIAPRNGALYQHLGEFVGGVLKALQGP